MRKPPITGSVYHWPKQSLEKVSFNDDVKKIFRQVRIQAKRIRRLHKRLAKQVAAFGVKESLGSRFQRESLHGMFFSQEEFDIRCEWGQSGVMQLAPYSDAVVIVDVLSFSTAVDVAVANGAIIYPFQWKDDRAIAYARANRALLASAQRKVDEGYSLSPTSLMRIPAGTRLVLPSPNGATLSLATDKIPIFAACLRNAQAVANAVQQLGQHITIVPAGERWADRSLRPSVEDWIGAGAVIRHLQGTRSPEAQLAEVTFLQAELQLSGFLKQCSSGKELVERGLGHDVELAALLNVSAAAPMLINKAYSNFNK